MSRTIEAPRELHRHLSELIQSHHSLGCTGVRVEFYPYTRLSNTIRLRDRVCHVRVSDILLDAPTEVLRALLRILVSKLIRTKASEEDVASYKTYVSREAVRTRARKVRRTRGRKYVDAPRGEVFDLTPIVQRLNEEYFQNHLQIERVGWSRRASKRLLGHYDPAHDTIVIDRRLDNPLVPEYVVEFVLYHEMLHASLGVECAGTRRSIHHERFQKAERKFRQYRRAKKFIDRYF